MKEQKKGSPLGTLWSWGKVHHGKFVFSIILAILGVACQMIPYFCVVNVISKMFAGETAFSAYLPVCLVALTGYCGKVLFSNLSTVISHNAAYSTLPGSAGACCGKTRKGSNGNDFGHPIRPL